LVSSLFIYEIKTDGEVSKGKKLKYIENYAIVTFVFRKAE